MAQRITTIQVINKLRELGYKVEAHKRSDGGWLIKRINDRTFTGAQGNTYAREILGVELSKAEIEQRSFNVNKYIRGSKKPKEKLEKDIIRKIRNVQAKWRKKKVKGKITTRKLRWHLKQGGRREAEEYLAKMSRYGEGYAYEENVEYLAEYVRAIGKGMEDIDKELAEATYKVAEYILSKKDIFKESWIKRLYDYWYEVRESGYNGNVCSQVIMKTYALIG